jgi:lipopolysaccharide transport system ATP-binding protein
MRPIIKVESLSKEYKIGSRADQFLTLRDTLSNLWRVPFRRAASDSEAADSRRIWALRDVGFEVMPGEIVGIVGRNGAGKSTLLKILSRITQPTSGQIDIYGRVGSLLEVGTGFNPELTGRENVYLNGAILGMRRREIDRKFDEIVEFSEVDKFIDTPVKHYSSGMYMRLAFGVAAHLEPEILIVDEVLAVGDFSFQKKCIGKISAVAREGRTVLFVSHNIVALRSLCHRAIWLSEGRVERIGGVDEVVNGYLQQDNRTRHEKIWSEPGGEPDLAESRSPSSEVSMRSVRLEPQTALPDDRLTVQVPISIVFEYVNRIPDNLLQVSFVLYNVEGICIFNGRSTPKRFPVGHIRQTCLIPGGLLNDDSYTVRVVIVRDTNVGIFDEYGVLSFDVHDVEREGGWFGKWIGVIRPEFEWEDQVSEAAGQTSD